MQKFKAGDKVKIINYGSKHFEAKFQYEERTKKLNQSFTPLEYELIFGKKMSQEDIDKLEGLKQPPNIIDEDENFWLCDLHPELVGKEGIVEGSYHDLYGHEDDEIKDTKKYSLKGIEGKSAWYNENQLELIK